MIFSKMTNNDDPTQISFVIGFVDESEFLRWKEDMQNCIRDAVQIMDLDDDFMFRDLYGKNIETMKECVGFICSHLQIVNRDGIKLIVLLPDSVLMRFFGALIGCVSFYHIAQTISDRTVSELMKSFSLLMNDDNATADDRRNDTGEFHVPEL